MEKKGETNLDTLLASMDPIVRDGEFMVIHSDPDTLVEKQKVVWQGIEDEGITSIIQLEEESSEDVTFGQKWKMITLNVHSSLEAIGFLATLLPALAKANIPVNVLSGYYHDHLLVPKAQAGDAFTILKSFSKMP